MTDGGGEHDGGENDGGEGGRWRRRRGGELRAAPGVPGQGRVPDAGLGRRGRGRGPGRVPALERRAARRGGRAARLPDVDGDAAVRAIASKSARARREQYVGTWLPEPLVEDAAEPGAALAHELSVGAAGHARAAVSRSSAAFLLHDVFELGWPEVAQTLERSEPAVRQLASRAREHVREDRPRFRASDEEAARLAEAFHTAVVGGDLAAISQMLAADAVFYLDGGGKRRAALNPIYGRAKILRFLVGIAAKRGPLDPAAYHRAWINGMPGFMLHSPDGVETLALSR